MLEFIRRLPNSSNQTVDRVLELTAEDRTRSRHFFETATGGVYLRLPRGTVLTDGDVLATAEGELLRIVAKSEPVLTVTASDTLALLRAAYHLGNRHVPLEVTETYLRLLPDPVLKDMLVQMGLLVNNEIAPFQPETGAYGHSHGSTSPTPKHAHVHS